jgi:hypothetical protein
VGYGKDGKPKVVMDILFFEKMTAEQSLARATEKAKNAPAATGWDQFYQFFVSAMVPDLRVLAGIDNNDMHLAESLQAADQLFPGLGI